MEFYNSACHVFDALLWLLSNFLMIYLGIDQPNLTYLNIFSTGLLLLML